MEEFELSEAAPQERLERPTDCWPDNCTDVVTEMLFNLAMTVAVCDEAMAPLLAVKLAERLPTAIWVLAGTTNAEVLVYSDTEMGSLAGPDSDTAQAVLLLAGIVDDAQLTD